MLGEGIHWYPLRLRIGEKFDIDGYIYGGLAPLNKSVEEEG